MLCGVEHFVVGFTIFFIEYLLLVVLFLFLIIVVYYMLIRTLHTLQLDFLAGYLEAFLGVFAIVLLCKILPGCRMYAL